MHEPSIYIILKVLGKFKDVRPLTAYEIAEVGNIEKTSENLQSIQDECYDLVEIEVAKKTMGVGRWAFQLG